MVKRLADEKATLLFGASVAAMLHPGLVVFLRGNLGAGKTTLTRGILRGMGYTGVVKSPTYNLVEIYKIAGLRCYHFDFYRFNHPEEWEEAGFREYFNRESVCLIEWPEKAGKYLPVADLQITLHTVEFGRNVEISAGTEAGKLCLTH